MIFCRNVFARKIIVEINVAKKNCRKAFAETLHNQKFHIMGSFFCSDRLKIKYPSRQQQKIKSECTQPLHRES
jgi:hypothetical protein